jgi:GxxExxY protein
MIMPVFVGAEVRRMDDEEFKVRVYEVMRHVFDVHNELGRLFHEKIYQRELSFRVPDSEREVPIELRFGDFCKTYYLDLLVGGGAVFETKAVESLSERHRRQLLQYLFLTDLPHGKLVNLRSERVQHEFVNNTLTPADRTTFAVVGDAWQEFGSGGLKDGMIAMLRDAGTGLDLGLYAEVAAHLCGQVPGAEADVEIRLRTRCLGVQPMRLAAPGIGIRITALPPDRHQEYQADLVRLLEHADVRAIQWINITREAVQFATIPRKRR